MVRHCNVSNYRRFLSQSSCLLNVRHQNLFENLAFSMKKQVYLNRCSSRSYSNAFLCNTTNKHLLSGFKRNNLMNKQTVRALSIHEFQSMRLMDQYNINTPKFFPAATPEEAEDAAKSLYELSMQTAKEQNAVDGEKRVSDSVPFDFVVKAQVLTGGRGLGYFKENNFQSGVHICSTPQEVRKVAEQMLGKTLVTKQTGSEGKICECVLITERFYIRKERYLAILLDRESDGPVILCSSKGGTNIEDIAEKYPESLIKIKVSQQKTTGISSTLNADKLKTIIEHLGFDTESLKSQAMKTVSGLFQMFMEKDCLLLEINPLIETHDGRVLVCDAKLNFDDNADYKQKEIFLLRDTKQMDSREVAAARHNLNYVGMDGDIGCMVNGAGLAMATMDLIQLHNGEPANFLDVGGGADDKQVMEALKILQDDPKVMSIFVNIFGGIMRCDIIAQGLIYASTKIGLTKPLIVRLEGTNKNKAKDLLDHSGIKTKIFFESDFSKAAQKAVKIASISKLAQETSLQITFQ